MRLAVALAAALVGAQTVVAQEQLGFRVRAWVQWDDQRIALGDGSVGGPFGIGFTVRARLEGTTFTIGLRPSVDSDSTTFGASIETRIAVSDSQAPTPLFAIDRYYRTVVVRRGEAAQLILPYRPEPGETAELNLRIEGPFEAQFPDSAGWMNRVIREPRGIYFTNVPYQAALGVTPDVCPGGFAVRLSMAAGVRGVDVLACGSGATPVSIPGLGGSWIVMIPQTGPAGRGERCLLINDPPPAGIRNFHPRSWAHWCAERGNPWAPVTVRLSTGEVLRAQLIP